MTDTEGNTRTYAYRADGLISAYTDEEGTQTRYTYSPEGCLLQTLHGDGSTTCYTHDSYGNIHTVSAAGQTLTRLENGPVTTLTLTKGDTLLHRRSYTYDPYGNCTAIQIQGTIRPEENGTCRYQYDALHRLSRTYREDQLLTRYQYDAYGNRTHLWDQQGETTYAYDQADRLIQQKTPDHTWHYQYDRRGALIQTDKNGQLHTRYTYDTQGRLIKRQEPDRTVCYRYDPLNRRSHKEILTGEHRQTIRYRHDPGKTIHTLQEIITDQTSTCIWYGENGGMEETLENGIHSYYVTDPNGTPLLSLTGEGDIKETYSYSPFGIPDRETTLPAGYAGYEPEEDGTYLAGCRYYDPTLGRFLSRDRLGGNTTNPQSQNPYVYVTNNPLTYTDPDGLSPVQSGHSSYLTGTPPQTDPMPYAASWQGSGGKMPVNALGCPTDNSYIMRSLEQIILGNYSDEVTLLNGVAFLQFIEAIKPVVKHAGDTWKWVKKGIKGLDELDEFQAVKKVFKNGTGKSRAGS